MQGDQGVTAHGLQRTGQPDGEGLRIGFAVPQQGVACGKCSGVR
jgi:hypothetical protein